MKALFIGGTGTISTACAELAVSKGFELTLLNRGKSSENLPVGVKTIKADISDEDSIKNIIADLEFDIVADFIAYTPEHIERDIRLFTQKTKQYIFISSASAYQKPLSSYLITESTPLSNPYWQYSRDKIACEDRLIQEYRSKGFPVTIVRPSHTYGDKYIPLALHGDDGGWQVIERILNGKPVIIPGDGLNWWTVTHNTDFAVGFVGLMGNVHALGEAVHITSDERLTWNDIYNIIGLALGKKVKAVHISADMLARFVPEWEGGLIGDKSNSVAFDNSKIKRLVPEFTATVRFDQGIRRTLEYIIKHPELQKHDLSFDALCDRIISRVYNIDFN